MEMLDWVRNNTLSGLSMNEMRLHLLKKCFVDADQLRVFYSRFRSLIMVFERLDSSFTIDNLTHLMKVIEMCTFIGLFDRGFYSITEPVFVSKETGFNYQKSQTNSNLNTVRSQNSLHFLCCDAGIVSRGVLSLFKHVIITSGTLSPMKFYPTLLGLEMVCKSISIDANTHLCPVVVSRGNDQV